MIKSFLLLTFISFVLLPSTATFAEPYSPSCEIALEKIDRARKTLVPFRRTLELVRSREFGANGEAAVCIGEGHCQKWQWQVPEPTKEDFAAVAQYRQERKEFEDLFYQAKLLCLVAP